MRRLILGILLLAIVGVAVYAAGMWFELYGAHRGPGAPEAPAVPAVVHQQRQRQQQRAASRLTPAPTKEILFGDDAKPTAYTQNVLKFLQDYQLQFERTKQVKPRKVAAEPDAVRAAILDAL